MGFLRPMFLHYKCIHLLMMFNSFKFDHFNAKKDIGINLFFSLGRMLKPLKPDLGHSTKKTTETLTNCIISALSVRMNH